MGAQQFLVLGRCVDSEVAASVMMGTQNACFAILHTSLLFIFVQYRPICYSHSIPNAGIPLHERGLFLCLASS